MIGEIADQTFYDQLLATAVRFGNHIEAAFAIDFKDACEPVVEERACVPGNLERRPQPFVHLLLPCMYTGHPR